MKEIFKKYKILIVTLTFLVLLLTIIFFVAKPFVNRIKEKADNIQKKKLDNQMDKKRIVQIPEMEEDEKNILGNEEEIDVILNHNGEVEFIKKLEEIAEQTGNKMTLNVDEKTANSKVKADGRKDDKEKSILNNLSYGDYINIKITLEGNYLEFINFINKLENFRYYVNIISLDLKKNVKITEGINSEAPKSGSIFSAPNPESLPKNELEKVISKKEKDTLLSTINIIVYIK